MLHAYARVFVRFLTTAWDRINREELGGALHPPVFRISEGTRTLGTWSPADRTLSISGDLLQTRAAHEVLEVLRHEMAHQYADEVLGAGRAGETPHGSGFRHACRLLGIDHQARLAPTSEPPPILSRIRKLLALAESSNEHEAGLAMARARDLMEKYEMEPLDETEPFCYAYLGKPRKQRPAVEQIIASTLVAHFGLKVVWIPSHLLMGDRKVWLLEACGTPSNLEVGTYVYTYLNRELEYLWLQHRRKHPTLKGKTAKREYQLGVMRGFAQKLEAEALAAAGGPGRDLVRLKHARLQSFFQDRHQGLRAGRRLSWRETEAYKAGFAKGRDLEIRKGVKRGAGTAELDRGHLLES